MRRLFAIFMILILAAGYAACGGGEEEPSAVDSDGDGWTDVQEREAGSDPFNADTDGDGRWDPLDPNPLDANIPVAQTPAPTTPPTTPPAPQPSPTGQPGASPTSKPAWTGPAGPISAAILQECQSQFLAEYEEVASATVRQSTDNKTIFLEFSLRWEIPRDRAKPLSEAFVELTMARVDVPPGAGLGPGRYDYVTTVTEAAGVLLVQGKKCADCDSMTWL